MSHVFNISVFYACSVATHILGACLLKKGETDEAEDLLRKALDMKRTACPDAKASIYAS